MRRGRDDLPGLRRQGDADRSRRRAGVRSRPGRSRAARDRPDAPPRGAVRGRRRHHPAAGGAPLLAHPRRASAAPNLPEVPTREDPEPAPLDSCARWRRCSNPIERGCGWSRWTPPTFCAGSPSPAAIPALMVGDPKSPHEITSGDPRRHPNDDGRCTQMLMLKLLKTYLLPYRKLLFAVLVLPVRADDRDAVPPDAQRRHHRQRRRQGRHRLHLAARRRDARRHVRPGGVRDRRRSYFGAALAMGFGRDVRGALFHTRHRLLGRARSASSARRRSSPASPTTSPGADASC